MFLLSIDVGIKNLAYCLVEREGKEVKRIVKWDIINLAIEEEGPALCKEATKGKNDKKGDSATTSTSIVCMKPAKYEKDGVCYCLKHAKKQCYLMPAEELSPGFVKRQKLSGLIALAEKHNIAYEKPPRKADLIQAINEYIRLSCFKEITSVKAAHVDLVTIGRCIAKKFDAIFSELKEGFPDRVVIENQISPIANRMKTIQGMLAQYFIMRSVADIVFVSATSKLKPYEDEGSTDTYSDRKKLGIQMTRSYLNENVGAPGSEWLDYFEKHKKKDDLADALLYAIQ